MINAYDFKKQLISETLIVSTVLLLLLLLLFQNYCMVHFFLHNHLFSFIYPSVSFCIVHLFPLKPLKSNFLQFIEEASTGQYVGEIS